jgi:deazaflavin-dependent oxidoreductase (nitroreductase family)
VGINRLMKRRLVHLLQKFVLNPPIRAAMAVGLAPPGYSLLESIGRKSGKPRRTPIGDGLAGDTFWIVTEHGRSAGYVKNIDADPRVRVKVRRGLGYAWRPGIAHLLEDDDPRERQRKMSRGHPLRRLNAFVVRRVGTEHLTVRIDLDSAEGESSSGIRTRQATRID